MLILGILLNDLLELLVSDQSVISPNSIVRCAFKHEHKNLRKHHQRLGFLVLELLGTVPLAPLPLLIEQELVELIGERCG
jgi:hypothetical protein